MLTQQHGAVCRYHGFPYADSGPADRRDVHDGELSFSIAPERQLTPQLLNTVSNLGGTWPKPLILRSVDLLSSATCITKAGPAGQCVTDHDRAACLAQGATCRVDRDGYYVMSAICVSLAAVAFVGFILPTVRRLQNLPLSAWRVKIPH